MADPPRYPSSGDATDESRDRESTTSSRWTIVLIVVFGLVFLVVVILHLAGGGLRH